MTEFLGLSLALIGIMQYAKNKNKEWLFPAFIGLIVAFGSYL